MNRRKYINNTLRSAACLAIQPISASNAVTTVTPGRWTTPLYWIIKACIKKPNPNLEPANSIQASMLDSVQYHLTDQPSGPLAVSRADMGILAQLTHRAVYRLSESEDAVMRLLILAAFRRCNMIKLEGFADPIDLEEYDQFMNQEFARIGEEQIAVRLDETLFHIDSQDRSKPKHDLFFILEDAARYLHENGFHLGVRAMKVIWRDGESLNQKRCDEAFPGCVDAYWSDE